MRGSPLQAFGSYLSSQAAAQEKASQPQQPSITISRETGSGAVTIAQMLVDQLNAASKSSGSTASWMVFDRNLAKQVLTDNELPQNWERFVVEDARLPVEAIVEELLGLHPTQWTLVQHTTKTILRLASLGRVILVGRGAEAITSRLPFVFHVRLVASVENRIRHASRYYNLTEEDAAKMIKEADLARRRYLRRYFDADVDDPLLYDVVLNTGRLGFVRTAELIAQAAMRHYAEFLETRPSYSR
jgi:cytidylate kinase